MNDATFSEVSGWIKKHIEARDWQNNPTRGLAISIVLEASELLEHYQWEDQPAGSKQDVADELADIFIYAFQLADTNGIDIPKAIKRKLAIAAKKYPAKDFKNKDSAERNAAWIKRKLAHKKKGL